MFGQPQKLIHLQQVDPNMSVKENPEEAGPGNPETTNRNQSFRCTMQFKYKKLDYLCIFVLPRPQLTTGWTGGSRAFQSLKVFNLDLKQINLK